jgi:tetratricopeptide (TPR) repeat protein
MAHHPRVKLDVAIGFSQNALEVLTRTRMTEEQGRREPSVVLAIALKNRGYALLVQGKVEPAIQDFEKAVVLYARLVGEEGEKDLAQQFAECLNQVAWIYATYPDSSFRDGSKAKEYAFKACQLDEWKSYFMVETLAAACAETGSFAEAVKWQEKALGLAPAKQQVELGSKLRLYRTGNR